MLYIPNKYIYAIKNMIHITKEVDEEINARICSCLTAGRAQVSRVTRLKSPGSIPLAIVDFLFSLVFKPAVKPIQLLTQWVAGAVSLGVKR
jgi:hypothetical protein